MTWASSRLPSCANQKGTPAHSEFPFKVLPQMTSRVECAGLDGRDRQTKALRRFRARKALHFAE
jgi:hypothetical protein